jgi:flagella basal body P-ring formation protein FlgA
LAWGWIEAASDLRDQTRFELRGGADNTRFVVVFDRGSRPPMATRLQVGVRRAVPVAARPLLHGDVVDTMDVELGEIVSWVIPEGPVVDDELPIGWEVRTSIARGEPVRAPAAWPPPAVQAGETIQVTWSRGPVHVVMAGTALNRAREGQRVRVRLEGGRGNVSGIVTAPGNVQFAKRER